MVVWTSADRGRCDTGRHARRAAVRDHEQHADRRPRTSLGLPLQRPRGLLRVRRVADLPPLRQPVGDGAAARRPRRALVDPTGGRLQHDAPLPRRDDGARDDLPHPVGDRGADRRPRDGAGQRGTPAGQGRPAPAGPLGHLRVGGGRARGLLRAAAGVRARRVAALRDPGRGHRAWGRGVAGAHHPGRVVADLGHRGRPDPGHRGRDPALRAPPVHAGGDTRSRVGGGGRRRGAGADHRRVAVLVRAAPVLRRPVAGPGAHQRPGAQGADLPAQRRRRRGCDHLARPRAWVGSATGTTATPGCATPA